MHTRGLVGYPCLVHGVSHGLPPRLTHLELSLEYPCRVKPRWMAGRVPGGPAELPMTDRALPEGKGRGAGVSRWQASKVGVLEVAQATGGLAHAAEVYLCLMSLWSTSKSTTPRPRVHRSFSSSASCTQ
jgi:hypothetical protein